MKNATFGAVAFALLVFGSSGVRAQQPAADSPPIEITLLGARGAGVERVADLKLVNVSSRRIAAYVISSRKRSESGRPLMSTYGLNIPGLGPPAARKSFAPGDTWFDSISVGDVDPADAEIEVDHVRFKEHGPGERPDWGPDKARLSNQITGAMAAYRMERARLKRLLEQGGPQAVARDLETEPAP